MNFIGRVVTKRNGKHPGQVIVSDVVSRVFLNYMLLIFIEGVLDKESCWPFTNRISKRSFEVNAGRNSIFP